MDESGHVVSWSRCAGVALAVAALTSLACGDDANDDREPGDVGSVPTGGASGGTGSPPSGGGSAADAAAGAAGTASPPPVDAGPPDAEAATPDAAAPAWTACFAPSGAVDTCDAYCAEQGKHCATTCETGGFTAEPRQASALTWDGPACNCNNPRCPAPDRATGWGVLCGAAGFATAGNALPRTSVQCCCAPGEQPAATPQCDELTPGMWVTEPAPTPLCGADGNGEYEEIGFDDMPASGFVNEAVQWRCFDGELAPRLSTSYELAADGCSGTLAGGGFYFTVAGDLLSVYWDGDQAREYRHAPAAPKRP